MQSPPNTFRAILTVCLFLGIAWTKAYGNWQLDATYMSPPQGVNERVYALSLDSANRLIAGGIFTQAEGVNSPGLARFFPDGTRDPSFDIGSGVAGGIYNYITDLIVLPDDSVIIVGDFGSFNGVTRGNIARIKANGSVDPDFANGAGADAMIRHIEHSGDGGYIIGGNFSNYDGEPRSRIAKLHGDGSLDESVIFDHSFAAGEWVDQVEVFDNGAVLAAGDFAPYDVTKFLATGATDIGFSYDYSNYDYVEATLITNDGKILIGGVGGLHRHDADGTYDPTFIVDLYSAEIYGLRELIDGRIVVSGQFLTTGVDIRNMVVVDTSGSIDTSAVPDSFESAGWVGPTVIEGENVVFAGSFWGVAQNYNTPEYFNRIARFNTNPVQNPPNAVYFDRNYITLVEGDNLNREFQLKIDETPSEPVTVFLEVIGSEPPPHLGLPSLPNSISVPSDGPNHTDISIRSDQDVMDYQGTRRVTHRIQSVSGDAVIGEPSEIEIILIDDELHPNVRFEQSSLDIIEGQPADGNPNFANIRFDSQPSEFASYRIEVEADTLEISNRISIPNDNFELFGNNPFEFEIDVQDFDDELTGPVEATLRIVPNDPGSAAYLGTPLTMTIRILDNEVAGGIRFDRSSLKLISEQEAVDIQTLISGKLESTELIYEIEFDDPEWDGKANFDPQQEWIGGRSIVPNMASAYDGNDGILKNGTARVRIRTEPDQPELLGEPSVLELTLYDDQSLDGWLLIEYPEDWNDIDILTRDGDSDGHSTLLEWFNETDPEDASSARSSKAELVRFPYLDQGEQDFLALRFYLGTAKPTHVAIVQTIANLSDPEWTTVWRSDEDLSFDSEQVVERPEFNQGWAVIRLPNPVSGQGFARLKIEPASD